jgi:FtsH-binding integral membrane protein
MYPPQAPLLYNNQTAEMQAGIQRSFITRVYAWMTAGLVITALTAFMTLSLPGLLEAILSNMIVFFGLLIGELVMVIVLTRAINSLSPTMAGLLFAAYAVLNGVTLSLVMLVYTESSVAVTFGVTACTFGIMTLFGYTTQRDLTKLGSLLIMGLVGIILASLVNLFLNLPAIYWIVTFVGILIFVGLIAYDTQKLKRMAVTASADGNVMQKTSILGALALYLDFINLFLLLLRLFGRRR